MLSPSECAFVTFLMLNDSFLPGALLQGHVLMQQASPFSRACLVTEEVSGEAVSALQVLFDHVVRVDKIVMPHARRHARQDRPFLLTRLQALRLGPDGDLGCRFRKIVLLDADILPLKRFEQLFLLDAPAGILNERKSHLVVVDRAGRFVRPRDVNITGCWKWHEVYGRIGHGTRIPRHITDRVGQDPLNLGVNTALMVLRPSMDEYDDLIRDLRRPGTRRLLADTFDWPDMQYLTLRWSGRWASIDASFCGICGYPSLGVLCGTHFAGGKPWDRKRARSFRHHQRFPDHRYWRRRYLDMMESHATLHRVRRLTRLAEAIRAVTSPRPDLRADSGSGSGSRCSARNRIAR
jgi:glycogenin glucosyltransferase